MKRATILHLMELVAREMYANDDLSDLYPDWTLRKDRGADRVINDERDYELQHLKSDRALLVFDAVAAQHRCGKGGPKMCRRYYGHESFVAWPELRAMHAAAEA